MADSSQHKNLFSGMTHTIDNQLELGINSQRDDISYSKESRG